MSLCRNRRIPPSVRRPRQLVHRSGLQDEVVSKGVHILAGKHFDVLDEHLTVEIVFFTARVNAMIYIFPEPAGHQARKIETLFLKFKEIVFFFTL